MTATTSGDTQFLDAVFEALSDSHRRRLLFALAEHNPQSAIEISDDVMIREEDEEYFHLSMAHNHLPRLEDQGFIEWDRRHDEVVRGPHFDKVEAILNCLDEAGYSIATASDR